jgi:DNA-binding NarL/FixJ family response regulator
LVTGTVSERVVLVQDRSRLFREAIALLLGSDPTLRAGGVAATADELVSLCQSGPVDAVILEGADVPWEVHSLVGHLRRLVPGLAVVGTAPARLYRHQAVSGLPMVPRTARLEDFVAALQPEADDRQPRAARGTRAVGVVPGGLTAGELQVLALISAGLSSELIAGRLKVSQKTVEKRRQRIFAKLGVQSQSQAVALAFRSGLLGVPADAAGEERG